jgi:hypothetical protein
VFPLRHHHRPTPALEELHSWLRTWHCTSHTLSYRNVGHDARRNHHSAYHNTSVIGKWNNKKENHGFFLLPSLRAEPPFEIEGWVSPSIVLGSVWEVHSPLYWRAESEGVIFIPVPQRTILVIGLNEGQVLDTAAYISWSVTIGRMTWQSLTWQSLIMNDAKSSPKHSPRRCSLPVLIGQTIWLDPVSIKARCQSQSSALGPRLRSRCQASHRVSVHLAWVDLGGS